MVRIGTRDEYERLRLNQAGRRLPEINLEGGGGASFVGVVTSTSDKIGVGKFFLVQPMAILGKETEGGSGSLVTVGSDTVPIYLLGPGKPGQGDYVVCRFVDHRWVAEATNRTASSTSGYIPIPSCFCQVPPALTMTSADPSCNYRMFQSCTIQYGPAPGAFSTANYPGKYFFSTESFPDPVAGGAKFYYLLDCYYNQFNLTRVYPTSPYGSPWRDAILYTWLVGGYGNTCDPFILADGYAYPGSDGTCVVTLASA